LSDSFLHVTHLDRRSIADSNFAIHSARVKPPAKGPPADLRRPNPRRESGTCAAGRWLSSLEGRIPPLAAKRRKMSRSLEADARPSSWGNVGYQSSVAVTMGASGNGRVLDIGPRAIRQEKADPILKLAKLAGWQSQSRAR
jgi:hypothetical protein